MLIYQQEYCLKYNIILFLTLKLGFSYATGNGIILGVAEGSWADRCTDLKKHVGKQIVKVNNMGTECGADIDGDGGPAASRRAEL